MKRLAWLGGLAFVAVALATGGYMASGGRSPAAQYRTARVDRGTILSTVSATGSLNAVTTVQVSSQVSGQIKELLVDYNTPVRKGQLIARLDPETFQAKSNAARAEVESAQAAVLNQQASVERARAEVESAQAAIVTAAAQVERVRADVENARALTTTAQANIAREEATVASARRELDRRVDLLRRQLIAQSDLDQAQTAFDTARAQLEAMRAQERAAQASIRSAEAQLLAARSQEGAARAQRAAADAALAVVQAQLKSADAGVRQKQAALDQAQADLARTEIRAPVDGVVVSRSMDVGQTVAASFQAPTLFTIAEDLTRMQVEAAVDEADIGRLRDGMPASFTVDAFAGESYQGQITQIRKAPTVAQNVVTYTVIIAVANPRGRLMPGMTATVRIEVDRRDDVLRIPNAALRFRLPDETPPLASAAAGAAQGPAADAQPPSRGGAGGGSLRDLRERLTTELTLSTEQTTRLDAILAEARQAFAGLRSGDLDERAREARRRQIRGEIRERIRTILSDAQQARYAALLEAQGEGRAGAVRATPGRVYVVGPDGTPRPLTVAVGASDGAYTELVRGELRAEQEVIVGQTTQSPRRSGGPRLRL